MKEFTNGIVIAGAGDVVTQEQFAARCNTLHHLIASTGLKQGDEVVVHVNDGIDLLPVMAVLFHNRFSIVLTAPGINPPAIKSIVDDRKPALVIASGPGMYEGTCACIVIPEQMDNDAAIVVMSPVTAPFTLFTSEDNYRSPITVDAEGLSACWRELDRLLPQLQGKAFLVSQEVGYLHMVITLWWAFTRKVTIIADDTTGHFSSQQYVIGQDMQPVGFSLFYFGSYAPATEKNKYKLLFDTVRFADEHGFTAVWTPERHFNEFGGMYPNPSLLSAALAVATTRTGIRSGSLVSPLHHTARIAEDWSVVDNLSNGRVGVSFASGWQCDDFIFYPEKFEHRYQHMIDQIGDVQRLWSGEKISCRNGLGEEVAIEIFPKPVQQRLPIWITVSGRKESYIDAGRIGANILTHMLWQDLPVIAEKIAIYRQSLRENGFPPASGVVTVMVHTYLGNDSAAVKKKVEGPLKNYLRTSTELIRLMLNGQSRGPADQEDIPEEMMDELVDLAFERFYGHAGLLGTVEEATGFVEQLRKAGVNEIACLVDFGLDGTDVMEGLTYLNTLKDLYAGQGSLVPEIGAAYFSAVALKRVQESPALCEYFSSGKKLLVNAGDVTAVKPALLPHLSVVSHNITAGSARVMVSEELVTSGRENFVSAISNDF